MPNSIEQIYNQLAQVFGGSNPNQVFSLLMPGTTLDAKAYSYDTTGLKPATVQEAESRLTDQLFDIAKVSGSSSGRRLSSQYLQAMSVLVPNFNPMMPVLKKTLRDFLNTPVPENTLLDDKPFTGSLKDYYFKLYEKWIAAKLDWEQQIVARKAELAKNPATANELFAEWYEQIAEAELAKIDEAMAKVLAVFSPADMDAILGVLASGPGGEVEEAVNAAKDIQLASPSGGYFYPVDLTPDDWFLDLASDLDPANLLKDPEFIGEAITAKRQALQASISQVQGMLTNMPAKGDIKTAADNLQSAQKAYSDAQSGLLNTYTDNTATAVEMYLAKHGGDKPKDQTDQDALTEINTNAAAVSKAKGENPPATDASKKGGAALQASDIAALVSGQKSLITAQANLQTTSQTVADAGINLASMQASYYGELPVLLARLQAQLADLANLQNDLTASISAKAAGTNALPSLKAAPAAPAAPQAKQSAASQRFMDLQFSFSTSDMQSSSSTDTSFSQTSWSVDLFFGSAGGSSSSSSSVSAQSDFDSSTEIQIGLKAAKIDVERGWFDPGIFKLSSDMSRISTVPIALPAPIAKDSGGNSFFDWTQANQLNGALFPCYPVAFLVVKDVNITFKAKQSSLDSIHRVLDSKSSAGGGFLCFSVSSSSASHSDHSSLSVRSQDTVINICMPGPQILGWFLELIPADKSTVLEDTSTVPGGEINIYEFVKKIAALSPPAPAALSREKPAVLSLLPK